MKHIFKRIQTFMLKEDICSTICQGSSWSLKHTVHNVYTHTPSYAITQTEKETKTVAFKTASWEGNQQERLTADWQQTWGDTTVDPTARTTHGSNCCGCHKGSKRVLLIYRDKGSLHETFFIQNGFFGTVPLRKKGFQKCSPLGE